MPQRTLTSTLLTALLSVLPAVAQPPQSSPPEKFEAASLRMTPPDKIGFSTISPYGGATYSVTNISLEFLVTLAYAVDRNQISGLDRLGTANYDLTAKPENGGSLTYERLKPMLRAMLEDRFKLATHREMKELPGYALVVAKGEAKLKASSGAPGQNAVYVGGLQGTAVDLGWLASTLAKPVGRPVVDKTGITGHYDIRLSYAHDDGSAADSSRPSIFTAVQEQLGLKLEPQKVSLEMLVIDHCERVPTDN